MEGGAGGGEAPHPRNEADVPPPASHVSHSVCHPWIRSIHSDAQGRSRSAGRWSERPPRSGGNLGLPAAAAPRVCASQISGLRWAASVGVTEEAWTLLCHGKPLDVGHMYFHTEKCAPRPLFFLDHNLGRGKTQIHTRNRNSCGAAPSLRPAALPHNAPPCLQDCAVEGHHGGPTAADAPGRRRAVVGGPRPAAGGAPRSRPSGGGMRALPPDTPGRPSLNRWLSGPGMKGFPDTRTK